MLITLGTGVLASIAAEAVMWFNKKLTGTVLQGKASFLLALSVSLVIAAIKVNWTPGAMMDAGTLGTTLAQVWVVAQAFFVLVVETLKLDVQA